MELLLSKVIPLFFYPLGLALLVALGACLVVLLYGRWKSGFFLLLIVGQLWLASMPVFANWLIGTLEQQYPEQAVAAIERADAILVLGGMLEPAVPPRVQPDLTDSVDRLVQTLRLYQARKAPRIIASGGLLPWKVQGKSEAVTMRDLLVELGVDKRVILVETTSRNTYENAYNTVPLLRLESINKVLLVTSAFHMPRAVRVFSKMGVAVVPVSTDVRSVPKSRFTVLDVLPDAAALYQTTLALKEYVGMVYYKWKGWI